MSIDYGEVVRLLEKRKAVSRAERKAWREDEDAIWNEICEGRTVLTLGWDGDFPGGSGAVWVTEWRDLYFCTSSDYDPEGPFQSLASACEMDWFGTATANPTLDSSELTQKQLETIGLGVTADDGDRVVINSVVFRRKGKELVEVPDEY